MSTTCMASRMTVRTSGLRARDKQTTFDPARGKTLRSIDVAAHAGPAFDGQHLFQRKGLGKARDATQSGCFGLESDGGDQFFCGGGRSGKVRTVRGPKRGSATASGYEIPVDSTTR